MRTQILTAALVTTLAGAALPAIAYESHGIPAFDRSSRTIYVDGEEFYLPAAKGTMKLADADYITLEWEQVGNQRVVQTYSTEREDDDS